MRSWWGYSPESLTRGVFFLCHTVKCRNPTVSVPPLRIHRGSVESESAAQKKRWVVQGQRGMKGQAEEKDMGPSKERPEIHKPHTTINPSRIHASFSYVCVRRSVWYRMQNIMPIHWYRYSKCERVVCWRCLTSIWFPEKSGQMKFYVFFFLSTGFFFPYWSSCFDQACQGAALCSLHGDTMLKSVWYVLHVRSTCKSGCSVLLTQGFSLLFLSFPFPWRLHSGPEKTRWVSWRTAHSLSSNIATILRDARHIYGWY